MLYKMICPQCNAPMDMDDSRDFMFCQYCGARVANIPQRVNISQRLDVYQQVNVSGTVMHRTDYSNEPNLIISYMASDPSVKMQVSIASIGVRKALFLSGQTMTFRLPDGNNQLAVKIGRINYKRMVFINSFKGPVRMYATWAKHAQINIDSPY